MKRLLFLLLALCATSGAFGTMATPSRNPAVVVPLLKRLAPPPSVHAIEEILGRHDRDVGSGAHVLVFELTDKSQIRVSSADGKVALSIRRYKSGSQPEAIFGLAQTLNTPVQHNADSSPLSVDSSASDTTSSIGSQG